MITSSDSRVYSPFWAIWSVFVTLIVLQCVALVNDYSDRVQINAFRKEAAALMPEVERVNKATDAMGRGLLDLANAGSVEARKIATEMQIKVNK